MDLLQGLGIMAIITLVPGSAVLLFDRYCERSYKRHEAMRRHPVGKGR